MSQGFSILSEYFQVYFSVTTVELELKNIINSLCFKSFINKKVDLWGPMEGANAPVVPPSYGPVP